MTDAEAKGTGVITPAYSETNKVKVAYITHNPSKCPNPASCYYIFSTYTNFVSTITKVSFQVTHQKVDPTDA